MRLLIDMDGVLADLYGSWVRAICDEIKPIDFSDWKTWEPHKDLGVSEDMYKIIERSGFFTDLKPLPNAIEVAEALWVKYDCRIVSAASYKADVVREKVRWLEEYFPFVNKRQLVFTKDKSIVSGDYLLDDGPHNIEDFPAGKILFDQPFNRDIDFPINLRVFNWYQVADFFGV